MDGKGPSKAPPGVIKYYFTNIQCNFASITMFAFQACAVTLLQFGRVWVNSAE